MKVHRSCYQSEATIIPFINFTDKIPNAPEMLLYTYISCLDLNDHIRGRL